MAIHCVNKALPEFKELAKESGINEAILAAKVSVWQSENGLDKFPTRFDLDNKHNNDVNYTLSAISILSTNKAEQVFTKGKKNGWDLNKVLTELNIPKEQKKIILDSGLSTIDEILVSLLANNSFVVEVNITKDKVSTDKTGMQPWELDEYGNTNDAIEKNTQHYSNLSVSGGTNYTENEISTPAIIPSIKGHAQFSTDNGIGWFRSDEQGVDKFFDEVEDRKGVSFGYWLKSMKGIRNDIELDKAYFNEQYKKEFGEYVTQGKKISKVTKTRRILELQSDLFQKGRDKKELTKDAILKEEIKELKDIIKNPDNYKSIEGDRNEETGESFFFEVIMNSKGQYMSLDNWKKYLKRKELELNNILINEQNQFLQFLNKKGNWVNFFIQSIIQDSAKKGYEKVLFPLGETAAKIEGHETIADELRALDDEIANVKAIISGNKKNILTEGNLRANKNLLKKIQETLKWQIDNNAPRDAIDQSKESISRLTYSIAKNESNENESTELKRLEAKKQELKTQGLEKFKPIEAFYENRVSNILNKLYKVNKITDEHGNAWNEIVITPEMRNDSIILKSTKYKTLNNIDRRSKLEDEMHKNIEPIKSGVNELFNSIPKLNEIGTQSEYSAYLKTVFPNSKLNDIVYHGSNKPLTLIRDLKTDERNFSNEFQIEGGIFFSKAKSNESFSAAEYGDVITAAVLNIKNPKKETYYNTKIGKRTNKSDAIYGTHVGLNVNDKLTESQINNANSNIVAVFEPKQVHILGSEVDLNGFKNFIKDSKLSDKNFTLINNLLNAVEGYPKADAIYKFVTSSKFNKVLDIVNGLNSVESVKGEDMYDVGMALFITKLAAEGKYKQSDNFISDALGMMFAINAKENNNSKEFTAASLAQEALDVLNDISLQYDSRKTLKESIDLNVIDHRTEIDKRNEAELSSNGTYLSSGTLQNNFQKLINFLSEAAKDFINTLKAFSGTSVRDIFTNPNMEANILIKPLAMRNKDFIIEQLQRAGAVITNQKEVTATSNLMANHYSSLKDEHFFGDAVEYYNDQQVYVMSVKINKKNLKKLNDLLGTSQGFANNVKSLRSEVVGDAWKSLLNETGVLDNGIHISKDAKAAKHENDVWFNNNELKYNRAWYNIGMLNRDNTVSNSAMKQMFKGLNFYTNNAAPHTALGKVYPNIKTLNNTVIVPVLTEEALANVVSKIPSSNLSVVSNIKEGVVTYKFELDNGKIGSIDVRTEKNLVQNYNKSEVAHLVSNYSQISQNQPPYGKLFKMLKRNLKGNIVAEKLLQKAENDYYNNDLSPDLKVFGMYGGFETIEKINVNKSIEWVNKHLPQANLQIAEGLLRAGDGSLNYGLTQGSIIALSDEATFGTEYHEALHFVLNNLVAEDVKDKLLLDIQLEYGLTNEVDAHEVFADLFRTYSLNRDQGVIPKGVQEMGNFIDQLLLILDKHPEIHKLFEDIHLGKYSSTAITSTTANKFYSKVDKRHYNQRRFGFNIQDLTYAKNLLTGLFLETLDSESQIEIDGKKKLIREVTNAERLYRYSSNDYASYQDLNVEEEREQTAKDDATDDFYIYANDIMQLMHDKLFTLYETTFDEYEVTVDITHKNELETRLNNFEKLTNELDQYMMDSSVPTILDSVIRDIKTYHGYSFKTIEELEEINSIGSSDLSEFTEGLASSSSQLMGERAIDLDPDTAFNPIVKQALAKLYEMQNVYEVIDGKTIKTGVEKKLNPLTQQPMYVDFKSFFPKFVNLMSGIKTSEQLDAKIKLHKNYLPELDQLDKLLNNGDVTFTLKQALLSSLNSRLTTEYFIDVNDSYKVKSKSKPGSYKYSDMWVESLRYQHSQHNEVKRQLTKYSKLTKEIVNSRTTTDVMTLIDTYMRAIQVFKIRFTVDELYNYAFDPNNAVKNIMTGLPIHNYTNLTDVEKITRTVGLITNRLHEVSRTLAKNANMKAVYDKSTNEVVNPDFDNYGDLNAIAKVKDLYGKEGLKLSYLDVNNNQKNQLNKINQIGDFMNMLQHESRDKVKAALVRLLDDPSMIHSTLLMSTVNKKGEVIREGLLIPIGNKQYKLNEEFIANFNYGVIGGIYNGKDDKKGLFRNGNEIDWRVQQLSYYFNNGLDNQYVQMPGMIPGDSANNYVWSIEKRDSGISFLNTELDNTATTNDLAMSIFKQESVRMKQAADLLFDIKAGKYPLKEGITDEYLNNSGFRKDYHYKLEPNGTKTFLKNGKPVGLVFKFHNFAKFNEFINPETGVLKTDSAWFLETFPKLVVDGKVSNALLLKEVGYKFLVEMLEEYLELESDLMKDLAIINKSSLYPSEIMDYLVNQRLLNIELQNLFTGLSSELPGTMNKNGDYVLGKKGQGQASVRLKSSVQGGTSGQLLNENGESMNVAVRYAVHQDLVRDSNSIQLIQDAALAQLKKEGYKIGTTAHKKRYKLITDGLQNIEVSDGGAFGTLNRWVEIQKSLGRYKEFEHLLEEPTPRYYNINPDTGLKYKDGETPARMEGRFNYKLKSNLNLTDIIKTLDAVKPVYTSRGMSTIRDLDGLPSESLKQQFVKYAWFPLTDFLTNGNPELQRIQRWMEANDVDELSPMTTEKQGTDYISNISDGNGRLKPIDANGVDVLDSLIVKNLNFADYKIQLEINAHSQDAENKLGVQIMKSIIANINTANDYNGISGSEMIQKHFTILNDMFKLDELSLEAKLNIEHTGNKSVINDVTELKDIILNELERTGLTEDVKLLLEINSNNKFKNVLDSSDKANKIISILNAQFTNNYKNTKFAGSHLTLMPDTGFKPDSMVTPEQFEQVIENLGIKSTEDFKELKIREVNGVLIADCLMPVPSKVFLDKDGKPMDITKIHPDLLRVMGYRIPNTGKHSNVVLNIVGFLPQEVGGLLVTAADFVGRTGWDFDIDSVYMMNRIHMKSKSKDGYKYVPLTDETYDDYYEHRLGEVKHVLRHTAEAKVFNENKSKINKLKQVIKKYEDTYTLNIKTGKLKGSPNSRLLDMTTKIFNPTVSKESKVLATDELEKLHLELEVLKGETAGLENAYESLIQSKGLIETDDRFDAGLANSKGALQNKLFDLWYAIQTSDHNLLEVLGISDFGNNTEASKSLAKLTGEESIQASIPVSNVYQRNVYPRAVIDKHNLGIFASFGSLMNIHQVAKTQLGIPVVMNITSKSLDIDFKNDSLEDITDKLERLVSNYSMSESVDEIESLLREGKHVTLVTYNVGRSSLNKFYNIQGELITHVVSEDIDNAADAIKAYLPDGINNYSKDVYSLIKAVGGTVNLSVMLTNQPFIKLIGKYQAENKRLDKPSDSMGKTRGAKKELIEMAFKELPSESLALINLLPSKEIQLKRSLLRMLKSGNIDKMSNEGLNYLWEGLKNKDFIVTEESLELEIKEYYKTKTLNIKNQIAIYDEYSTILDNAESLAKVNKLLKQDKKSIGNNFNNTFNVLEDINNLFVDFYAEEQQFIHLRTEQVDTLHPNSSSLIAAIFPRLHTKFLAERLHMNTKQGREGYYTESIYPGIEDKFINANLKAHQIASDFMVSENYALKKATSIKLHNLIGNQMVSAELESMQGRLINYTVQTLGGTTIQKLVTDRLKRHGNVSQIALKVSERIEAYLTSKEVNQHHPFNYIQKSNRTDSFNKEITVLKTKFIEGDSEVNLIHSEINKLFDSSDTEAKGIYSDIVALSYLLSGFRHEYSKLNTFVTEYVKDKLDFNQSLSDNKDSFDNPILATVIGNRILDGFFQCNTHNNTIAPIITDNYVYQDDMKVIRNDFTTSKDENGKQLITINDNLLDKFNNRPFNSATGYIKKYTITYNSETPTAHTAYTVYKRLPQTSNLVVFEEVYNTAFDSRIYNYPINGLTDITVEQQSKFDEYETGKYTEHRSLNIKYNNIIPSQDEVNDINDNSKPNENYKETCK